MKIKTTVWLSVCALIVLFQGAGAWYAYRALAEKTDKTLKTGFRKAFDLIVDEQLNALPFPDGTVTHTLLADPAYLQDEEFYSFYTSQQTSAILQDAYGQPEISLDSLRLKLENELRYDGVEGELVIRKFDAHTGETLQRSPDRPERHVPGLYAVSEKAYLHEARGIAVEAQLCLPFYQGYMGRMLLFYMATLGLALAVIIPFVIRTRKLKQEQAAIDGQRLEFYRQAKEMERPVRQLKADLKDARWGQAHEVAGEMLAATETTLTHAKQKDDRAHRGHRRFSLYWLLLAFVSSLLLTFLWSYYIWREQRVSLAHEVQVCFEEAFVAESATRYQHLIDSLPSHPRMKSAAPFLFSQWDSLARLGKGNDWFSSAFVRRGGMNMGENARVRRAYNNQEIFLDAHCPYVPLDSFRMDSLFNARLLAEGLPGGYIRFFEGASDSLEGQASGMILLGMDLVTRPVSVTNDRTRWMEGVVAFPESYIFRSVWYLFVSLQLISLFTLAGLVGLWYVGRRLRKLGQFREDFTYSMIHDMKSPLQSVLMGTQVMASGRLADKPERARGMLRAMADECDHLLTLSNRVVTLTQMERGELELHKTAVVLRPLLDDLSGKFRLKAPKPVAFEVDCPSDFRVMADAFCLREVLSNLIDNAIKYSREEVSIRLSAESGADGSVTIRVRDNGIGIPPREQQRIFGKFERVASGSRATGASGFGLGLNFVWQVVRAHGGRVEVRSDGMSYSEFAVVLPG